MAPRWVAETSAASIIQLATHFHIPVSTTHTITASIMGVGATQRLSAVRWGVAGNIAIAWVVTLPASGLVAGITYLVLNLFFYCPACRTYHRHRPFPLAAMAGSTCIAPKSRLYQW